MAEAIQALLLNERFAQSDALVSSNDKKRRRTSAAGPPATEFPCAQPLVESLFSRDEGLKILHPMLCALLQVQEVQEAATRAAESDLRHGVAQQRAAPSKRASFLLPQRQGNHAHEHYEQVRNVRCIRPQTARPQEVHTRTYSIRGVNSNAYLREAPACPRGVPRLPGTGSCAMPALPLAPS